MTTDKIRKNRMQNRKTLLVYESEKKSLSASGIFLDLSVTNLSQLTAVRSLTLLFCYVFLYFLF